MKNSVYILLLLPFLAISCAGNKNKILFSYKDILDKEYRFDIGRPIPLTIEQAIETEADISRDAMYMYYASDKERGNFDIYLRSLSDIKTIRLTEHSSRDYSPAISPDGRVLLFVSNREDPEGDIYSSKINPEDILKKADSPVSKPESIDTSAKNLTAVKDDSKKSYFSYKDSSPVWSSDGKKIAYSSNRTGMENIWIMDSDGGNKKQITSKGGIHPKFSPDSRKIIFISYRDGSSGDIFEADPVSGSEKLILKDSAIKLYPSYRSGHSEITYTAIESDTNGDGKIDLNDNAVLLYRNLNDSTGYPLTLRSRSSFNSKWLPVFESQTVKGVIVYSEQAASNININAVPDTGIIPKRLDAAQQYNLADSYLNDYSDIESHLLGLEMVFHYYGKTSDRISIIYGYKALADLYTYYYTKGDRLNRSRILNLVNKFNKQGNDFSKLTAEYLNAMETNKNAAGILDAAAVKYKASKDLNFYVPFILETAASNPAQSKNKIENYYSEIISGYKNYSRLNQVNAKYLLLTLKTTGDDFSPILMELFKKGSAADKINLKKHFIETAKKSSPAARISFSKKLKDKYKADRETLSLLLFIEGEALFDSGNFTESKKILIEAVNISIPTDLMYYKNAVLLGDIFSGEKNIKEAENHYYSAASKYRLIWKENNFRDKLKFLVNYYEESGERSEDNGNFPEAVIVYEKYANLMSYIHRLKKFEDIYNKYGSRAHVLYIDSFLILKGEKSILELEKQYQKNLAVARLDFDKAFIYGLGYIYTRIGLTAEKSDIPIEPGQTAGLTGMLDNFKKADDQIDWSLFIDETFIDPYILKTWVYQYLDLKRNDDEGKTDKKISRVFPSYLLEKNIDMLDKAVATNNESSDSENEGNLHLNLANNYFLLTNYPRALHHYRESQKFKKAYGSIIEEALLYYHLAYCYWQTGDNDKARMEIKNAIYIYDSISAGSSKFDDQKFLLMKYFALFNRMEKKYREAISWYEKLLALAEKSGLTVDKARYLQEIAFCNKESGKFEKALSYVDQADKLLETYPDKDEKYYLQIRLFGLGPFSLYDLGQDTVVIGDNKIFSSLGTKDKKLYGLSLREEIYSSTGQFNLAVDSLNRKIEILKKKDSKTSRDSMTATLNNAGYYYYNLKNYNESRRQFNSAWDYATSPKVNDLTGAFTSIMNIVNLYAFSLESGLQSRESSTDDLNRLIEKINSFRENYEKNKFSEELKDLKKEAESRKRKIEEKEIDELKKKIREDADKVYYKIDIALGVLYFYKAELSDDIYRISSADDKDALNYIKKGKELFSLYSEALFKFEKALEPAESFESKRLYIKLLLNAAASYSRIGTYNKAYELYIDARDNSEKYLYQDLMFVSYLSLAEFLRESGSNVEGKDSVLYASENYQKAVALAEASPLMFTDNLLKITRMYNRYISLLISAGDYTKAFSLSEQKYSFERLAAIYYMNPSFSSEEDSAAYKKFVSTNRDADLIRNKISKLYESGSAPDSKEISGFNEKLKEINSSIKSIIKISSSKNPLFAGFMDIPSPDLNEKREELVVKFYPAGKTISAWKVNKGKVQFKFISDADDKNINEKIKSFIKSENEKVYIISDSGFNSVKKYLPDESALFFAPSFSAIKYLNGNTTASFRRIFTSSKNLKDILGNAGFTADYSGGWDSDLSSFSALADMDGSIKPLILFSKTDVSGKFLIKKSDLSDYKETMLVFESALYSGIRNIIFISDIKDDAAAKLIFDLNSDTEPVKENKPSVYFTGPVKIKKTEITTAEAKEISSALILKDAVFAFRSGNHQQAEILADKILSLKDKNDDSARAVLLKSLNKIAAGDLSGAEQILIKSGEDFSEYKEKALLDSLILLNKNKLSESVTIFENGGKLKSALRGINTALIYKSVLKLSGFDSLQKGMPLSNEKFKPSSNEKIMISFLDSDAAEIKSSQLIKSWLLASLHYDNKIFNDKINLSHDDFDKTVDAAIKNSEISDFSIIKSRLYLKKAFQLKSENRFDKSYEAYIQAEKFVSPENDKWNEIQLIAAELESKLNRPDEAGQRLKLFENKKQGTVTLEEKTTALLIKSRIELLRIAKLKSPTVNDAVLFEKLFSESMNYFVNDTQDIPVFRAKILLFEILDAYINFKMRTGNHSEAAVYADFKKHFSARAYLKTVPENSQSILTIINNKISFDVIQKKLNQDSIIIYNIRNGKNIFSWIIGNNFKMALIIENGFDKLKPVLQAYDEKISAFKNTYSESKAINEIFAQLEPFYRNKKAIYFITDSDLEKVPYEIMGSKIFLDESHKIYYLSSLASAVRNQKNYGNRISLISGNCSDIFCELEKTAISESRFKFSYTSRADSDICHLMSDIKYDMSEMSMSIAGIDFFTSIKSTDFVYSSSRSMDSIGFSNFSLFAAASGAGSVLISSPKVRDINSGLFADSFYKNLSEGKNVLVSFENAKIYLKSKKEFKHPAYWGGIRLYLNGL